MSSSKVSRICFRFQGSKTAYQISPFRMASFSLRRVSSSYLACNDQEIRPDAYVNPIYVPPLGFRLPRDVDQDDEKCVGEIRDAFYPKNHRSLLESENQGECQSWLGVKAWLRSP
jgi:hypothetical protein